MKLFDLHCDTLTEIFEKNEVLQKNTCHISLENAFKTFEDYTQVLAVYSKNDLSDDENYDSFIKTIEYGKKYSDGIENFHPIYAVEGAKLLGGDIEKLKTLASYNVKILTLVWGGECCIGGAWDTNKGLTSFGRSVVNGCYDLGIIPDLSHASDEVFYETAEIAARRGGTIIVSHSCSREICQHRRNITDDMARTVSDLGGIIGVNLVIDHLGGNTVDDVCAHIERFSRIAGEDKVCLGCDLDGTSPLPDGINNVGDLYKIYNLLVEKRHSQSFADAVFCSNAQKFANEHFLL